MKRIALFFGMAVVLVASCSTQEIDFQTSLQENVEFYASFEQPNEEGTRVYANEDLLLRWTADDRVGIFNKLTYNQEYKFTGQTGANAGGFKKVDNDEFVTGNEIPHVVSVYPYQETSAITESEVLSLTLPSEQPYAEKTFGLGANTMVSVSEDNVLQYKNVGGYLMLKLYGEGVSVSRITLKGNNGEILAGRASVTMPLGGVPTVSLVDNATTELAIIATTPVQLGASAEGCTQFWFVIPPITFEKGFTITVKDSQNGVFEKTTVNNFSISRNKVAKMSALEVVPVAAPISVESISLNKTDLTLPVGKPERLLATILPEDATDKSVIWSSSNSNIATVDSEGMVKAINKGVCIITAQAGDKKATCQVTVTAPDENSPIVFADEKVKAKLVAAFDTDGDGEISYAEAAVVTSIQGAFGAIKTYKSFDEFQYFTGVTSVPNSLFEGWNSCTSIILPSSILSIGDGAFKDCISIEEILLPSGITYIGSSAFYGCTRLKGMILPSELTSLNSYAFYNCTSLESIVLPEGLSSIGGAAFYNCSSLKSINLPNSIRGINSVGYSYRGNHYGTFEGCTSLEEIVLPNSISEISSYTFANCYNLKRVEIPNGVSTIRDGAFLGCRSLETIILPDSVNTLLSYNYREIHFGVFEGCSGLKQIVLSRSITSIPDFAFYRCSNLDTINISDSITYIGSSAFSSSGITSFTIPESISVINNSCFSYCTKLTNIIIPESVSKIDLYAFSGCSSLKRVSIPDSVIEIAGYDRKDWNTGAFSYCTALEEVRLSNSLKEISNYMFSGCESLSTILIPDGVERIGAGAFYGCSHLKSISLPNSVTTIDSYGSTGWPYGAFSGCSSLESVSLGESLTKIGAFSFEYCSSLTKIIIPSTVTSIGVRAFRDCKGLTEIVSQPTVVPLGASNMFDSTNNCPIYVPAESIDAYKSTEGWSQYASRIQAIHD